MASVMVGSITLGFMCHPSQVHATYSVGSGVNNTVMTLPCDFGSGER